MEAQAFAKAALENPFLLNPIGIQFVTIWKKRNLGATLGLPTAWSFTPVGPKLLGIQTFSLPLQRGSMTIKCVQNTCF
jgi:hypothetical protein